MIEHGDEHRRHAVQPGAAFDLDRATSSKLSMPDVFSLLSRITISRFGSPLDESLAGAAALISGATERSEAK